MAFYEGLQKKSNFSMRMSVEMRERIQRIADAEHITPAYVVRNAVERLFKEEDLRQENLKKNKIESGE